MEKLLKNHNKRISSQEKINCKQTDDITILKSQMESKKRKTEEKSGRVKRLVSQKLAETKPSLLPPYPDNPDITNRRGKNTISPYQFRLLNANQYVQIKWQEIFCPNQTIAMICARSDTTSMAFISLRVL